MRVSRLYVDSELQLGQTLELETEAAHYLRTVLRLQKNAQVILFNGQGGEYRCILEEVSRKKVSLSIDEKIERSVESPLKVSIGMGLSRSDRMDMTVQKSVELGVYQITPIMTQRSNVVIKKEKLEQKCRHWQKIAQHAAEQCGRTFVPKIHPIMPFNSWVENQAHTVVKVFLDPFSQTALTQLKNPQNEIIVVTGSEGGFCEAEKQTAISHNFIPISLGQRILRTETASLAALSAVQLLWGDFNNTTSH
ncbi:MAG: 16S rRNA (uracil(1498)-N(3))-methyltransferase [Methylococcales bacterium]|nr:16S rRNA (uracil(1498)-N(3))-methyltransferase [Methylococcales bacterium]